MAPRLLLVWLFLTSGVAPALQAQEAETVFPLSKGACWIYQGEVRWTRPGESEVEHATLTWKMEVVDTFKRGSLLAALIKGHPMDLTWYEEGREQGDYVILFDGAGQFYLLRGERARAAWQRLADPADALENLTAGHELFLAWPLKPGQVLKNPDLPPREDTMYQWVVEEQETKRLEDVKGVDAVPLREHLRLALRTLPDHQFIEFVPGVGITHYLFGHHGTVSEVDVKLVEVCGNL